MRSIKLADILGKKVDDDDILKALAPQISLPPAIRGKILLSYAEYRLKVSALLTTPLHSGAR